MGLAPILDVDGTLVDTNDWTSAEDVDATKPAPDLVEVALRKAGTDRAAMVGDSVWDCRAAGRAGIPAIAILTGGFSEQELRDAGAVAVFESLQELGRRLEQTPLGAEVTLGRRQGR